MGEAGKTEAGEIAGCSAPGHASWGAQAGGQSKAPGIPGARCPVAGQGQHTLNASHVGLTLGAPSGPLEWEVSEIHDPINTHLTLRDRDQNFLPRFCLFRTPGRVHQAPPRSQRARGVKSPGSHGLLQCKAARPLAGAPRPTAAGVQGSTGAGRRPAEAGAALGPGRAEVGCDPDPAGDGPEARQSAGRLRRGAACFSLGKGSDQRLEMRLSAVQARVLGAMRPSAPAPAATRARQRTAVTVVPGG